MKLMSDRWLGLGRADVRGKKTNFFAPFVQTKLGTQVSKPRVNKWRDSTWVDFGTLFPRRRKRPNSRRKAALHSTRLSLI